MCIWNAEIPVSVDVREFESLAEQAQAEQSEEKKMALYVRACETYRGEFLNAGEESPSWVKEEAQRYRELYFSCLRKSLYHLKRCQDYEQMLLLSQNAADLYPYEEWQLWVIDSLLAANRYREAMKVYQTVTKMYFEDLKKAPSEQMLERFHLIGRQVHFAQGTMEDVCQVMQEAERIRGPYYCVFPGFIDSCRFISRGYERLGIEGNIVLCTLTDHQGWPLEKEDSLEEMAPLFMEAVSSSLRKGDLFTRYSANQFLILLTGACREHCAGILNRLNGAYKRAGSGRNQVNYYMASLQDMEKRGGKAVKNMTIGEDMGTGGRDDSKI